MTGREAAKATERDAAREQSRIHSAAAPHRENQIILDNRKKSSERNRRNIIAQASQAQDEIDAQLEATATARSQLKSPITISSDSDSNQESANSNINPAFITEPAIRWSNRAPRATAKAREMQHVIQHKEKQKWHIA